MGIMEAFSKEGRTEVTFSTFYSLVKEAAKAELMMNAVKCDVPHRYIRETMTGCGEPEIKEAPYMTIETENGTATFTKKKDGETPEGDEREGSKHEGKSEKSPQGGGHDATADS